EALYLSTCASCHGPTGQRLGAERAVAEGAVPARNLADPALHASRRDADLAAAIRGGGLAIGVSSQMPATDLSDEDVAALVAHLRTLDASRTEVARGSAK